MYKIVVFSAAWCPNCGPLKNALTANGFEYEVIDCDTEEGQAAARVAGVRALPTSVVYDNEEVVRVIVGNQPISTFAPYKSAIIETSNDGVALNG